MPTPRRPPVASLQEVPAPYLQCSDCGLTVRASRFYPRGDRCPRCQTTMTPTASLRAGRGRPPAEVASLPVAWSSAGRGRRFGPG